VRASGAGRGGRARCRPREQTALAVQGAYYVATGVAPFVSRRAFEAVTGPKREWWLVETVGLLVTCVGGGLLGAALRGRVTPEIEGIAAGCAVSLGAIEVVYVARGRIRPTYLLDAVVQAGLLGWGVAARRRDGPAAATANGAPAG
jgi:hypothetical protein